MKNIKITEIYWKNGDKITYYCDVKDMNWDQVVRDVRPLDKVQVRDPRDIVKIISY